MNEIKKYGFTTTILHSDRQKPIEHGSLHKPIHTSVTFGYRDARQLALHSLSPLRQLDVARQ